MTSNNININNSFDVDDIFLPSLVSDNSTDIDSSLSSRTLSLSISTPSRWIDINSTTSQNSTTGQNNNHVFFGPDFSPSSVESLDFDYYNGSHTDTILMPLDEDNFHLNLAVNNTQRARRNAITSISASLQEYLFNL